MEVEYNELCESSEWEHACPRGYNNFDIVINKILVCFFEQTNNFWKKVERNNSIYVFD
jgi:hypothetical protein